MNLPRLFTLWAALTFMASAHAAPVADSERIPVDLRRTTLVVKDLEASLALYRDAIGMKVVYDNMVRSPREANSNAEADSAIHLVFLQANDTFVGILGLMQYEKPIKPAPASMPEPFNPGSIVLLFNTDDLEAGFARVSAVPGVKVLNEPRDTYYPSYDGKGRIPARVSILVDPDGHVVEYNQLMMDPAEMLK
jgi:catechol 2,3-dioxygenase-like lactoylglutathione lyase family enzyme